MVETAQVDVSKCGAARPIESRLPPPFEDSWRTDLVNGLVYGILGEYAYDRMLILADALEEAGCNDTVLLRHCRECQSHLPECWVLQTVRNQRFSIPAAETLPASPAQAAARETLVEYVQFQVITPQPRYPIRTPDNTWKRERWAVYYLLLLVGIGSLALPILLLVESLANRTPATPKTSPTTRRALSTNR